MMRELLQTGLTDLNLPTNGIPALIHYAELLLEKNKVMNLTAITEPADIAGLHFRRSYQFDGLLRERKCTNPVRDSTPC